MLTYEQFKEKMLADAQALHDGAVSLHTDNGEDFIMFTAATRSDIEVNHGIDGAVGTSFRSYYYEYADSAEKGKDLYDKLLLEMLSWAKNEIKQGKHIQGVELSIMPDGSALTAEIKQKLPLFAYVTADLAKHLKLKGIAVPLRVEIIDAFDAAEASGVLCAFKLPNGSASV